MIRISAGVSLSFDSEEGFAGDLRSYLEDVDDHLDIVIEDLKACADLCKSYYDEFGTYQDKRMNDILFCLTIVTTLFVPAQFFTGLFGMNFVKEDGTPNMPLLTQPHGYAIFWIMTLVVSIVVFLMLCIVGWVPIRACNRRSQRMWRFYRHVIQSE